MAWLLDTNVLSERRKPRPEPKVTAFYEAQPLKSLYISVVNIAEIRFGIELQPDVARRAELHDWLTVKLRPAFAGRTLPVTEDILLKWRTLMEDGRKTGHLIHIPTSCLRRLLFSMDSRWSHVTGPISIRQACPCSTRGSRKAAPPDLIGLSPLWYALGSLWSTQLAAERK
jgi:hypothetical protein